MLHNVDNIDVLVVTFTVCLASTRKEDEGARAVTVMAAPVLYKKETDLRATIDRIGIFPKDRTELNGIVDKARNGRGAAVG